MRESNKSRNFHKELKQYMKVQAIDKQGSPKRLELLAPAGSKEALLAAIEAGANAVYLGVEQFNARNRAKNFLLSELESIVHYAKQSKVKVYLTVNTLIKNNEIPSLLAMLAVASQSGISAVIIQDWGIFFLIKMFFPKLTVHLSTQNGQHNNWGDWLCRKLHIPRMIMARELTLPELEHLTQHSKTEIEIFVHGALCYSFSGACLFSSFLGGMSANRGLCRQPCRRLFQANGKEQYLFNLKDLQLILLLPKLKAMGIASIKIEGRMRRAEYVWQAVRSYRLAIDNPTLIPLAIEMLQSDTGREKTSYFAGGHLQNTIAERPGTGSYIGIIKQVYSDGFSFFSLLSLHKGDQLRVMPINEEGFPAITIKKLALTSNPILPLEETPPMSEVRLYQNPKDIHIGDYLYLSGMQAYRPSGSIRIEKQHVDLSFSMWKKRWDSSSSKAANGGYTSNLFVRTRQIEIAYQISKDKLADIIIPVDLRNDSRLLPKEWIRSLPLFISEMQLEAWNQLIHRLYDDGCRRFQLSHLSQLALFAQWQDVNLLAGETVYSLNDAAIQQYNALGIKSVVYPYENDIPNLYAYRMKAGIVPLYFRPRLFYSRQPLASHPSGVQDQERPYRISVQDGWTSLLPENPVCIFAFKAKLQKHGYKHFLIDLSEDTLSNAGWKELYQQFVSERNVTNSSQFNFKQGLW